MADASTSTATNTPRATDQPLGQMVSNDNYGDALKKTQQATERAQKAIESVPSEVSAIKEQATAKEQSIFDQMKSLTEAQAARLKEKPPQYNPTPLTEQWGSAAMFLAMIGSAFTRTPLTNALNAGAAVMKAYQQRDYDAAQQLYKTWEHDNDTALKLSNMQMNMLEKAMENIRNASRDDIKDKMDDMRLLTGPAMLNIPVMRSLAEAGQYDKLQLSIEDMKNKLQTMQRLSDDVKETVRLDGDVKKAQVALADANATDDPQKKADAAKALADARAAQQEHLNKMRAEKGQAPVGQVTMPLTDTQGRPLGIVTGVPGQPDSWTTATGAPLSEEQRAALEAGRAAKLGTTAPGGNELPPAIDLSKVPDDWKGRPNTPPPDSNIDPGIWSAAIAWVKSGGTIHPPFSLWGRNNPQAIALNQAIPVAQKALNLTPEEVTDQNIKFAAGKRRMTAIESAFGTGMLGRNMVSLNTVADHLQLLRQYAIALQNKDAPLANQIINRMATQAGFPEVIQFALAKTIAGDEVIRLLTTTGGTEADRAGLQKLISEYGSPDQLIGAIDTAANFVRGRYDPLKQNFSRGDADREEYFLNNMLTPQARQLYEEGPAGTVQPGAAPSSQTGGVIIQNGWRYDAKTHQPLGPVQ